MSRRCCIAVEGRDGSGKTTLAKAIAKEYGGLYLTYDPAILRHDDSKWPVLFAQDRARRLTPLIYGNPDKVIVLDRWSWSGVVHAQRHMLLEDAWALERNLPIPDLLILLDPDDTTVRRRLGERGEVDDLFLRERFLHAVSFAPCPVCVTKEAEPRNVFIETNANLLFPLTRKTFT